MNLYLLPGRWRVVGALVEGVLVVALLMNPESPWSKVQGALADQKGSVTGPPWQTP